MVKRKPKARVPIRLDYALSIEAWDLDYHFSVVGERRDADEVYADRQFLRVHGTLSHPHKSAGRRMGLTFLADKDLLGPRAHLYTSRPRSVGAVTWSRNANAFDGVLSIPDTALPVIVPMLIGKRFGHVMLRSNGPFRRSLDVGSFSFIETLTPDHLPDGQW